MTTPLAITRRQFTASAILGGALFPSLKAKADEPKSAHHLYVASPGIRDYLEYGGHGILVFDIDNEHKFVKRIPSAAGKDETGKPRNVKGICASGVTKRIYVSTTHSLSCFNMDDGALHWEKSYEGGCDRMSIKPDGSELFVPSFEKDHWNVIDGKDGSVITKVEPKSGAHNTVFGPMGKYVYLAGLRLNILSLLDPVTHKIAKTIEPFTAPVRPLTVSGDESLVYANVNSLLGFEIGDVASGKVIRRVAVEGYKQGPVKRHGCPSHGIGMTPDGSEIWVCDAFNQRLHLFSSGTDPKVLDSIKLRDEPGWIKFDIDGKFAYPSTGEVIDVKTRKIVANLTDEAGRAVQSEKMIDIKFDGPNPQIGDQFGRGRAVAR